MRVALRYAGNLSLIIALVMSVLGLAMLGIAVFGLPKFNSSDTAELFSEQADALSTQSLPVATPAVTPTPAQSPLSTVKVSLKEVPSQSEWLTFTTSDGSLTLKHPAGMNKSFLSERSPVTVQTTNQIRTYYQEEAKQGCPGRCGSFKNSPELLGRQFELLQAVAQSPSCEKDTALRQAVEKDFILFHLGVGRATNTNLLRTDSGLCVVSIVESDGFDVALSNFEYEVAFRQGDTIYNMTLPIFTRDQITEIDAIWQGIGDHNGSCDGECLEAEGEYYGTVNFATDPLAKLLQLYSDITKTMRMVE